MDACITKLVSGTLDGDITQETLRAGFINLGAHHPEAASVQANGPAPVTAFRPVMLTSGATQPVATVQPIPGLTSLFRPQPTQPVSAPTSFSVPAMSPVTALTKGTTFTPIPCTHGSSTVNAQSPSSKSGPRYL